MLHALRRASQRRGEMLRFAQHDNLAGCDHSLENVLYAKNVLCALDFRPETGIIIAPMSSVTASRSAGPDVPAPDVPALAARGDSRRRRGAIAVRLKLHDPPRLR